MKYFFCFFLALSASTITYGQKIKYKDIYPQLQAKEYKYAERKLKEFLSDEKNADHASGHLEMAAIWEDKVSRIDPIKEPSKSEECISTAIEYFQKAATLITEKEVSKNDEFYTTYSRRDLRTGKYGVKVSDITLDIEERIARLEQVRVDLEAGKSHLATASTLYNEERTLFFDVKSLAPDRTTFAMRASSKSEVLEKLNKMILLQPKVKLALENAKINFDRLPRIPFDVVPTWKSIESFATHQEEEPKFLEGDFTLYDYADWSQKMVTKVENDVNPVMAEAYKYDLKLSSEIKRVQESQYMEFAALTTSVDKSLMRELKTLQSSPYLAKLYQTKIKELPIQFYLNTNIHPSALDTADVDFQRWYCDTLLAVVQEYSTTLDDLMNTRFSYANWAKCLDGQYTNKDGYQAYLQDRKDWATTLQKAWTERRLSWLERSRWGVQANGEPPIPMFSVTGLSLDSAYQNSFFTFAVMKDSINDAYYVAGVERFQEDKKQAFLAHVSNARTVLWKKNYPVGKVIFGGVDIDATGAFIPSEDDRIMFCLYTPSQGVRANTAFIKTDVDGKLIWKTMYEAQSEPQNFIYDPLAKVTSVYFGEISDPSTFVFELNAYGKILKK